MRESSQLPIKRQPFAQAIRTGTWLHLGLVAFMLFQYFYPEGSVSLVTSLGLVIDWIVGSLYSRNYGKTWPVRIVYVAIGGMFADLFARCAAGLVIGIFYFFSNVVGGNFPFEESLLRALSAAGNYVIWGAFFGMVGAAYSYLREKGIITGPQTLMLFMTIASLWIAQYTYDTVSTELVPGASSPMLNWVVAGLAVLIALYVPNKTDGITFREFGLALLLMLLWFFISLAYLHSSDGGVTLVRGFPFGIFVNGWQRLTILMNLLFWFNVSFLLTSVRTIAAIRSYSRG